MKPTLDQIVRSVANHTGTAADVLSGRRGRPPRWASNYRAAVAFVARAHGHELDVVAGALGYRSKGSIFYGVMKIEEGLAIDGVLTDLVITVMREFDAGAALQTLAASIRRKRELAEDDEQHSPVWFCQQHERFVAAMREAYPERELECRNGRFVKPERSATPNAALSLSRETV